MDTHNIRSFQHFTSLPLAGDYTRPNDAILYYNFGLALFYKKDLAAAIESLRMAIEREPISLKLISICGISLGEDRRFSEAIDAFHDALRYTPNDTEAYWRLGQALNETGQFLGAIDAFRQSIQRRPDIAIRIYVGIGWALRQTGQLREAIDAFLEAVRLAPDLAEAHYQLGEILEQSGQHEEAIKAYRAAVASFGAAVSRRPDAADALFSLGVALWNAGGLYKEIISVFREAIQLRPDFTDVYYGLGNALIEVDEREEAIDAFRKGLELAVSPIQIQQFREKLDVCRLNNISETNTTLGQNFPQVYNINIVANTEKPETSSDSEPGALPDLETTVTAAAHYSGRPVATFPAQRGLDSTKGETTNHRSFVPHPKLTPEQIDNAKAEARLQGLELRYRDRLAALRLPEEGGFTTSAEAKAAARLAENLRDVQRLQAQLRASGDRDARGGEKSREHGFDISAQP